MFAGIETLLAVANRRAAEQAAGQNALFGADTTETLALPKVPGWPLAERLRREFDSVGFFLSGHPLDGYAGVLGRMRVQRWTDFVRAVKGGVSAGRLAATVLDRAERRTRSGSKMGIVQLSDQSGQYEAILFQEGLDQFRDKLVKGASLLLGIQAQLEGEDVRARIVSVESLDEAASRMQKGLQIFVRTAEPLALDPARAGRARRRRPRVDRRDDAGPRRDGDRVTRALPDLAADRRRRQGDPGGCVGGAHITTSRLGQISLE